MAKTLDFIFDFGSPNAYLTYNTLDPLLERTGATLKITPSLLGGLFKMTGNKPPFVAFGEVPAKMAYENLEMMRFIKKHGLTKFKMNPHFPVNTLLIMRGLVVAQTEGKTEAYIEAILPGMWEDALKMDDPTVVAPLLDAAGFDGEALLKRTQDQEVKDQLMAHTNASVERGVFGIPTFFVGEEMFFGKDRMDQVEEALNAS